MMLKQKIVLLVVFFCLLLRCGSSTLLNDSYVENLITGFPPPCGNSSRPCNSACNAFSVTTTGGTIHFGGLPLMFPAWGDCVVDRPVSLVCDSSFGRCPVITSNDNITFDFESYNSSASILIQGIEFSNPLLICPVLDPFWFSVSIIDCKIDQNVPLLAEKGWNDVGIKSVRFAQIFISIRSCEFFGSYSYLIYTPRLRLSASIDVNGNTFSTSDISGGVQHTIELLMNGRDDVDNSVLNVSFVGNIRSHDFAPIVFKFDNPLVGWSNASLSIRNDKISAIYVENVKAEHLKMSVSGSFRITAVRFLAHDVTSLASLEFDDNIFEEEKTDKGYIQNEAGIKVLYFHKISVVNNIFRGHGARFSGQNVYYANNINRNIQDAIYTTQSLRVISHRQVGFVELVGSIIEVLNCKCFNTSSDVDGGCLSLSLTSDLGSNVNITGNSALTVSNSDFRFTKSSGSGGAFFINLAKIVASISFNVRNNTFESCSALKNGGSINFVASIAKYAQLPASSNSSFTLSNNSFVNSSAVSSGGVISINLYGATDVDGRYLLSTFIEGNSMTNSTASVGGSIHISSVVSVTLRGNSVLNSDATIGAFVFFSSISNTLDSQSNVFLSQKSSYIPSSSGKSMFVRMPSTNGSFPSMSDTFRCGNEGEVLSTTLLTFQPGSGLVSTICALCGYGFFYFGTGSIAEPGECESCSEDLSCLGDGGLRVRSNNWATFDGELESLDNLIVGKCYPGHCCEDFDCAIDACPDSRDGFMCSRCTDGYVTNLRMECEKKSNCGSSGIFILVQCLLIPVFVALLLLSKVGSRAYFKSFAYFIQTISMLIVVSASSAHSLSDMLLLFASPINLKFFSNFGGKASCPFDSISPSGVIALGLISPLLYIFGLLSLLSVGIFGLFPSFCFVLPFRVFFCTGLSLCLRSCRFWWNAYLQKRLLLRYSSIFEMDSFIDPASKMEENEGDGEVLVINEIENEERAETEDGKSISSSLSSSTNHELDIGFFAMLLVVSANLVTSERLWSWRLWYSYNVWVALFAMILLSYQTVAFSSLRLLNCTYAEESSDGTVLYEDAEVLCYQYWQYLLWIAVVVFIFPAPLYILFSRWAIKALYGGGRLVSYGPTTRAFMDCFEGPYKHSRSWWESVMIGRRLILLTIAAFSSDPYTKCILLTVCNLLILTTHVLIRPFSDFWVQSYETLSLTLLVLVSVLGLKESVEVVRSVTIENSSVSALLWCAFWSVVLMCILVIFVYFATAISSLGMSLYRISKIAVLTLFHITRDMVASRVLTKMPNNVKDGVEVMKVAVLNKS